MLMLSACDSSRLVKHWSHVIPSMMTSLHDSQYTPPLLLHMIVAPLPVIVMLFSDPLGVVVFSVTDYDVMFIVELLVRCCKA